MPKVNLKTPEEIALAAEGGEILGRIIVSVLKRIRPGLNTLEINDWIEEKIIQNKAKPSFKFVPGYHWAACIGVNNEVVHSIPRKDRIIKEGDLLKIDAGVLWKGFHTDASWTVLVGNSKIKNQKSKFLEVGKEALKRAIEAARPGNRIGNISLVIQQTIEKAGYRPVKVLTGHGIGHRLHEEPLIPCVLKGSLAHNQQYFVTARAKDMSVPANVSVLGAAASTFTTTSLWSSMLTTRGGWTTSCASSVTSVPTRRRFSTSRAGRAYRP